MKATFICDDKKKFKEIFTKTSIDKIAGIVNCDKKIYSSDDLENGSCVAFESDIIFSTWGMPSLTDETIRKFKKLKALFYAAGSVKSFASPFLNNNVRISCAKKANAIPVAEFIVSQIVLSCKRYFRIIDWYKNRYDRDSFLLGNGANKEKVALIGGGEVSKQVIRILQSAYNFEISLVDPYLSSDVFRKLKVKETTFNKAFSEAMIISNNLPDIDATKNIIDKKCFESMRYGATFINTGRGSQVNEDDFIDVFRKRKDLTALLDVTKNEPLEKESVLFEMDNIYVSPHIAGASGNEYERLAECVLDDFILWYNTKQMENEVTYASLEASA